jgi:hypothetical protein
MKESSPVPTKMPTAISMAIADRDQTHHDEEVKVLADYREVRIAVAAAIGRQCAKPGYVCPVEGRTAYVLAFANWTASEQFIPRAV